MTISSYITGEIIKIISPNYTFLPANSKFRSILTFAKKCLQNEFVDTYYVMLEPRAKLLLIATHEYSAILDACAVITALMKHLDNNFQLTVGCWKFN